MIRLLLWILSGALLGGIVHLVAVLMLPQTATQDAYSRLAPLTSVNAVTGVCRYELSSGPIKLTAPVTAAYTSVSFYTRRGVAYYAINDRAAGRRIIELDLMTTAQRSQLPEEEDVTAADRLIVESPTQTGLIVFHALAPESGLLPTAQAAIARAKCQPQPMPQ